MDSGIAIILYENFDKSHRTSLDISCWERHLNQKNAMVTIFDMWDDGVDWEHKAVDQYYKSLAGKIHLVNAF